MPLFSQSLFVARSYPPSDVPEDEDTENLIGDESDGEATEGDRADDSDNADDLVVEQRGHNVETLSDTESSPKADHGLRADDIPIPDAALLTDTPAPPKRSAGGFVDEDSLFDE